MTRSLALLFSHRHHCAAPRRHRRLDQDYLYTYTNMFWTGTYPSQPSTPKIKRMSRRKSLSLLTATPSFPIPPSLQHSPYLTSPSIFSQTLSSPSLPSYEDEKWLQDTIPTISAPLRPLVTESDSPSGRDLRGSTVQLSRRASQKTSEVIMIEESQNAEYDVYVGVAIARTDSLAPPPLLLIPENAF